MSVWVIFGPQVSPHAKSVFLDSIASQYRDGHRKTANFNRSGFLAADVDRGLTLDGAMDHAFVRHHAALIHTTASHTPEHHRCRIIFLLDEPIMSARDWEDAQLGVALTLDSDRTVSDGARMFFGNTQAVFYDVGWTMPPKVVADLIARGRDARATRAPGGGLLPVVSVRRIAGPELIKVAGGELLRMDEIGAGVRVHCPHHDDDDPSAFTLRSKTGQVGIHCSACKVTFWSSAEGDDYDFKSFDRICNEKQTDVVQSDVEPEGLDRFFPPAPSFVRHRLAFLPPFPYAPGITMVKSAKGSGKTEALKALLSDIRAGRYFPGIARKERINSVLLIGHRQSLIREAAAKLGLRCYLDADDTGSGMRTLAVCLDSLPKYNESNGGRQPKAHDLVIIDESEQVLAHLLSDTIEKRYGIERCFDALMYEVANAKAVIALDADLGLVTAQAMQAMRPQDWASRCRIILNEPAVRS
jgi:Origin of replication binding protein